MHCLHEPPHGTDGTERSNRETIAVGSVTAGFYCIHMPGHSLHTKALSVIDSTEVTF